MVKPFSLLVTELELVKFSIILMEKLVSINVFISLVILSVMLIIFFTFSLPIFTTE